MKSEKEEKPTFYTVNLKDSKALYTSVKQAITASQKAIKSSDERVIAKKKLKLKKKQG